MSITSGEVYIVATPIGNLKDITLRALDVFKTVDFVLAEDTRRARQLFEHFGIATMLRAFHDHNETQQVATVVEQVSKGANVALISDAGTPLISDPGYGLVKALRHQGINVYPVPGACAAIAALSVCGLPTDRFVFEGFLPSKQSARQTRLAQLEQEQRTLVFYEAPHRILASLGDMRSCFGDDRVAMLGREMTKRFETYKVGPLIDLCQWVSDDSNQQKGESVIVVSGSNVGEGDHQSDLRLMRALLEELSVKKAVSVAAKVSRSSKNELYKLALSLRQ